MTNNYYGIVIIAVLLWKKLFLLFWINFYIIKWADTVFLLVLIGSGATGSFDDLECNLSI